VLRWNSSALAAIECLIVLLGEGTASLRLELAILLLYTIPRFYFPFFNFFFHDFGSLSVSFSLTLHLQIPKLIATLIGHKGRVNVVKWLENTFEEGNQQAIFFSPLRSEIVSVSKGSNKRWTAPEVEFVSGSTDKTIICWKRTAHGVFSLFSSLFFHS
jgi:hypothetical protein